MEFAVLGWSVDGPTLSLDHEQFAYAGKFVTSDTGKAVVTEDDDRLAAVSFSPDRTDDAVLRIRYVTVRRDRQGEGLGPQLLRFVADRATAREFEAVLIAVNNPYAYEAAYRAGFAYTGEETGVAELVLSYAPDGERAPDAYRAGLDVFADRELPPRVTRFLAETLEDGPPDLVGSPVASESGGETDAGAGSAVDG